MKNHVTLDLRGNYWGQLSHTEQEQLLKKFPRLKNDPNYSKYRYAKTNLFSWAILDSLSLPLATNERVIF